MGEENNHSPTEGPNDSELKELFKAIGLELLASLEELERMMVAPKCESSKIVTADSAICEEEYPQHSLTIQQKDGLELTLALCLSCAAQIMQQHAELNE